MTIDTLTLETEKVFLKEYQRLVKDFSNRNKELSISEARKKIFFIVRNRLWSIFDNQIKSQDSPVSFSDDGECESIIIQPLLSQFQYNFDENANAPMVTPRIISDLFETSLGETFKQKEGTYYTSRFDVVFMCKEALVQYIKNKDLITNNEVIDIIWQENPDFSSINSKALSEITQLLQEVTILDPASGCGEFLLAMASLLNSILNKIYSYTNKTKSEYQILSELLSRNLFGVDINQEALDISKKRLFYLIAGKQTKNGVKQLLTYNLACKDLLIDTVVFENNKKTNLESFDIIIGNPPFLRQETFGELQKKKDQVTYKEKVLAEIENLSKGKEFPHRYLKSDFYIYFFYKALNLLKENGVVCFITSNSWLDATFGFKFQEYLLNNFILNKVYTNLSRKSFSAAINTIVTLISNKSPSQYSYLHAKFVAFKILNGNAFTFLNLKKVHNQSTSFASEAFRLISITQKELFENGTEWSKYVGLKWGAMFFRAPDNYNRIFKSIADKFISLKEIGKVRYPIKTGINEFFFVDKSTIEAFNLEKEFLVPVLKSPKTISKIQIEESDVHYFIFNCSLTKQELTQQKKLGALEYIKWGEEQLTEKKQQSFEGIKWPDVPSVRRHKPKWYSAQILPPADIFCTRFFDRRFFFCYSKVPLIEDQTFYGLVLNNSFQKYKELIIALVNSTVSYYFLEIFGRTSLGKGALQYTIGGMNNHRIINPKIIPQKIQQEIISRFQSVREREIQPIFEEVKMSDRLAFDKVIFEWLNFSEKEISEFYCSFIELTKSRLEKSGQKVKVDLT